MVLTFYLIGQGNSLDIAHGFHVKSCVTLEKVFSFFFYPLFHQITILKVIFIAMLAICRPATHTDFIFLSVYRFFALRILQNTDFFQDFQRVFFSHTDFLLDTVACLHMRIFYNNLIEMCLLFFRTFQPWNRL